MPITPLMYPESSEEDTSARTERAHEIGLRGDRCLGTVEVQGHAVAETPTDVARALLYIVRASPSFLHK